jgi:hypothetical protein
LLEVKAFFPREVDFKDRGANLNMSASTMVWSGWIRGTAQEYKGMLKAAKESFYALPDEMKLSFCFGQPISGQINGRELRQSYSGDGRCVARWSRRQTNQRVVDGVERTLHRQILCEPSTPWSIRERGSSQQCSPQPYFEVSPRPLDDGHQPPGA